MIYYNTGDQALDAAKKFLRGNKRPHVLISRNRKGFMVIDPRDKRGHYSIIIGKLYRKK
tara:strand:+ start:191 stop:367 length:177 start_codon:yes stop_codon:yes gene_type:complete